MRALLVVSSLLVFCVISFSEYNGGTFLALVGKDSVVLTADSRFSSKLTGSSSMLSHFPRRIFRVGTRTLVGCYGIDGDTDILMRQLRKRLANLSAVQVGPQVVARVISDTLYNSGIYCMPIVAGIDLSEEDEKEQYPHGKPYVCYMDRLGAMTVSSSFAIVGTGVDGLTALCEKVYMPQQSAEDLVAMASKCLQLALQRDVLSGGEIRILSLLANGDIYETKAVTHDV